MSWFGVTLVLICLAVMISIVASTLRTGISPMPSSTKARRAIMQQLLQAAENKGPCTIVDLGSGWGHLVIPLARHLPAHQIVGYELSWLPWIVSLVLKHVLRLDNLTLYRRDFLKPELPRADIITCYLFASAMAKLSQRLTDTPGQAQWLVSNFFALPGFTPVHTIQLNDLYQTRIYSYRL